MNPPSPIVRQFEFVAVSIFLGVLFLVGGGAMVWYRRKYMALLREISVTVRRYDPGDRYMRRMEWMAGAMGVLFGLVGMLMLVGGLDLFAN
ncbi:MAG TPA: hypothetical protein VH572_01020 [Gaiella sp.]